MKQHQFEAKYQKSWDRFEWLLLLNSKGRKARKQQKALDKLQDLKTAKMTVDTSTGYEFITLYRVICQHYALSKQRHYSPQLVQYLQQLVIKGHQQLYKHQSHIWSNIYQFFRFTFPIRLRRHAGLFWISLISCLVPAILMGWACYEQADMIYSIMPDGQVRMMEDMYNPSNEMIGRGSDRHSDTDIMMFGHYISNNIGIDFKTYASGIFAGIGTLLILLYNGLSMGGVAGHLTSIGFGSTFWSFVSGHASFELTAMVISGVAGLRLAQSLFMPGNYSRLDAFKIAGKQSIELLIGAAVMTFIAAFIEAFWSSSSVIPDFIKYTVAAILWALLIGYLLFAGRRYERDVLGIIPHTAINNSKQTPDVISGEPLSSQLSQHKQVDSRKHLQQVTKL